MSRVRWRKVRKSTWDHREVSQLIGRDGKRLAIATQLPRGQVGYYWHTVDTPERINTVSNPVETMELAKTSAVSVLRRRGWLP